MHVAHGAPKCTGHSAREGGTTEQRRRPEGPRRREGPGRRGALGHSPAPLLGRKLPTLSPWVCGHRSVRACALTRAVSAVHRCRVALPSSLFPGSGHGARHAAGTQDRARDTQAFTWVLGSRPRSRPARGRPALLSRRAP